MIAILHPYILHYREEFFHGLNLKVPCQIYCYEEPAKVKAFNHENSNIKVKHVKALKIKSFILYNPFVFLSPSYDTLVLMLSFTHISTWLLLITKPIHKKKIILMGHGISIKRFLLEEKKPNFLLRWMIALANGVWFYTEHELNQWKKIFPELKAVSLNNTLPGVGPTAFSQVIPKEEIKTALGITQDRIIIYCARFNELGRRIDLLEQFIELSDPEQFGFIIIGDGRYKPDFSKKNNVYDFGALYDAKKKTELFSIADIYFQPGWVGLSIVEAMAYGKAVFTFVRSVDVLQCVEYAYIIDNYNGIIFSDMESLVEMSKLITDEEIERLGNNGRLYFINNLSMDGMIQSAYDLYVEVNC